MTPHEILIAHPALASRLADKHPLRTAATAAGILLEPRFLASNVRLEALVHLAVCVGRGSIAPKGREIKQWLDELGGGWLGSLEDPAESLFVTLVHDSGGNFRIFEGIWESSAFHLQRFVNVVDRMPDQPPFASLRRAAQAMLRLSDEMAERRGLGRYTTGEDVPVREWPNVPDHRLKQWRERVRFSRSDLRRLNIALDDLTDFVFDPGEAQRLLIEEPCNTTLERRPLVWDEDRLTVLLPTAISAAVRRGVAEWAIEHGLKEQLEDALADEYARVIAEIPLLGELRGAKLQFSRVDGVQVACAHREWEPKKWIKLTAIADDLTDIHGTGLAASSYKAERWASVIEKINTASKSQNKNEFYLSIVILCGYGRPAALGLNDDPSAINILCISLDHIKTLSWLKDSSVRSIVSMFECQKTFENFDIHLADINGLLNTFATWRQNDYRFLPRILDAAKPNFVSLPTDSLRFARQEATQAWDEHRLPTSEGKMVVVRRYQPFDPLADSADAIAYFSVKHIRAGRLLAAFPTSRRIWWLSVPVLPDEAGFYKEVWDTVCYWFSKVVFAAETRWHKLPLGIINVVADFRNFVPDEQGTTSHSMEPDFSSLFISNAELEHRRLCVQAQPGAVKFLHDVRNIVEVAMVRALLQAIADLVQSELGKNEVDAAVIAIIPNKFARKLHQFHCTEFEFFARTRLKEPLLLQGYDEAVARTGLGWSADPPNDLSKIQGKKLCSSLLHDLVDKVWRRLKARLSCLNRHELVKACLGNLTAIAADQERWEATSAAMISLHGNDASVFGLIAERQFKRNGSDLGSRLLVEMAVCECRAAGGAAPTKSDLAMLMTDAGLLSRLGNWAEAIKHGAMRAELVIDPNGEVLVEGDFERLIVEPLGRDHERERTLFEVAAYEGRLSERSFDHGIESIDIAYRNAFAEEFGFALELLPYLVVRTEEEAVQRQEAVFTIARQELIELLRADMSKDVAARLVDEHTLVHRPQWEEAPDGYKDRDWQPWAARRRLSILWRPLIDVGQDWLVVAPAVLRKAGIYRTWATGEAVFSADQFSTSEMKSWIGEKNNRSGMEFNQTVADRLSQMGYRTQVEVKPTKILNAKLDRDYGDVDVLAWRDGCPDVLAIECKRLHRAVTLGGIAQDLAEFRGGLDKKGRPDRLRKAIDRWALLERNLPAVARYIGRPDRIIRQVRLIVTNELVPPALQPQSDQSMGSFVTIAHLAEWLEQHSANVATP